MHQIDLGFLLLSPSQPQFLLLESIFLIGFLQKTNACKVLSKIPDIGKSYQVVLVVKKLPANAGDARNTGSVLGLGRSPREGNGYPLQYSCLEDPVD